MDTVGERRPVRRTNGRRRSGPRRALPASPTATCRAIVGAGSPSAPAAQPNASIRRRRASATTAPGRSSKRVPSANSARRSASVSLIEAPSAETVAASGRGSSERFYRLDPRITRILSWRAVLVGPITGERAIRFAGVAKVAEDLGMSRRDPVRLRSRQERSRAPAAPSRYEARGRFREDAASELASIAPAICSGGTPPTESASRRNVPTVSQTRSS